MTPALILFWPFVALTGHYLFHRQAVAIFCALGFMASAGLLGVLWRRYFSEVSVWVVAACVLALGLATGVPVMLLQCDAYEVPVSCGYMLTMLALGAIWCALHTPQAENLSRWLTPTQVSWLAAASLAYGLALGARPNLVLGAAILLVPVFQAWRERRPIGALLLAAIVPITLIGLGLMLYNAWRFDSPFEFGVRYQLAANLRDPWQYFSPHFVWLNLRMYFLEQAHWSSRFPFVGESVLPHLPPGHQGNIGEKPFGVLTSIPLVWLALGVPLAWRGRSTETRWLLRDFLGAVGLFLGSCVLILLFWQAVALRYEVEFLPALVLLAVVGILGLERAPVTPGVWAGPVWRRTARWGWGLLLGFSVAFNLLAGIANYPEAQCYMGNTLFQVGRIQEAIGHYEQALRLRPDFAEAHSNLGMILERVGKTREAIGHYEQALRFRPDFAEAHNNLGIALEHVGRTPEAIGHYEQAVQINPDLAEAHYDLGGVLLRLGRVQESIGHYEQLLRIKPNFAEAHNNLGNALHRAGRLEEATVHFEQAVRIKPDYSEGHYNLGVVLQQAGKIGEAIGHYEQALRINPDLAEAHNNLGSALVGLGRAQDAIGQCEQALQIKPDFAEAHYNLAVALELSGRREDAMGHYEEALRIKPDFADAKNRLARLTVVQ